MTVIRINKTNDYTIMSNYHLKEPNMSLKAKGLLSLMLSLPDNWDYSIKGLVSIYRNPTHHTLNFQCTREYAIKVCLFIDELLSLIDLSELVTNGE